MAGRFAMAGFLLLLGCLHDAGRSGAAAEGASDTLGTRTAREIIAAWKTGLPLAASWNCNGAKNSFNPAWQIETLVQKEGHMIFPWFSGQVSGANATWEKMKAYYEVPLGFCRDHNLPLSFRATQWEDALLELAGRPEAENPCLIHPDGSVEKILSPFGPEELWYQLGRDYNRNEVFGKLQELYPDPPLVLVFSNNEPHIAKKVDQDNCKQLRELLSKENIKPDDKPAVHRLVEKAWEVRYTKLLQGLRDGLVNETWKKNLRHIPYNMFNNTFNLGADVLGSHVPRAWDGISTHLYTSDWETCRDFWVASPQGQVANIAWSFAKVRESRPDFIRELSIWYDNDPLVKLLEYQEKQTYTTERYRGVVQYVLWALRPQILREFRGHAQTRQEGGKEFYAFLNAVDRVHRIPLLKRFWLEGLGAPNNDAPALPKSAGKERWFILNADANKETDWTKDTAKVNVYALALVLGERGSREWLLYAHAPLKDWKSVAIAIPEYRPVTVDVPVGGMFYHVKEHGGLVAALDSMLLPNNHAPEASDDEYAVGSNEKLTTSNHRFLGIAGACKNDGDPDGDPLKAVLVDQPRNGKVQWNEDGTFTYEPRQNFSGVDCFTYKLSDGQLESQPARVTVTLKKLARIIDDTDPGFADAAVPWKTVQEIGFQGDICTFTGGNDGPRNASTATWTFSELASDTYEVWATWPKFSFNMPKAVPFEILDGEKSLKVMHVDQTDAPKGSLVDGAAWQSLGAHAVSGGTLRVVLSNEAKGRWVIADALRITARAGGKSKTINNGEPGFTTEGHWLNSGNGHKGGARWIMGTKDPDKESLAKASWTFQGLKDGLYEVYGTWPASTTHGPVTYGILDGATRKGAVLVDQTEPPVDLFAQGSGWECLGRFAIQSGTLRVELENRSDKKKVLADAIAISDGLPVTGTVQDDAGTGFTEKAPGTKNGPGYGGTYHLYTNAEDGAPAHVATWRLAGLAPGRYRVCAVWKPLKKGMASSGVTYRLLDGQTALGAVTVDQTLDPACRMRGQDGIKWQALGEFKLQGDGLTVELLSGSTPGALTVADAIWAEPVEAAHVTGSNNP